MLRVMERVPYELADVVILDPVDDLRPLPPGADESSHPQLREVLRHRRRWLVRHLGKATDRQLTVEHRPQQPHTRGVGKHPEDLDREVDLLCGSSQRNIRTCIHAQILAERGRLRQQPSSGQEEEVERSVCVKERHPLSDCGPREMAFTSVVDAMTTHDRYTSAR